MDTDIVAMLSQPMTLLTQAAVSLWIAAALGAALAFRPIRHGTSKRDPEVILIHRRLPIRAEA